MIKAIGFDFDGTLIISEKEKKEIIAEIFMKKYGFSRGVKSAYSALRGRMNREEKLKKLVKKFMGRNATKKEISELSFAFSKGYEYKLSTCPLVHCQKMIGMLRKKCKFMFLLSLEEKTDVKKVAEHCGVAKYFDEILGGPKNKISNFKHILKKHKIHASETIYIGDSRGDVINAKKLGILVVGINSKAKKRKAFEKLGADFVLSDLCELNLKSLIK